MIYKAYWKAKDKTKEFYFAIVDTHQKYYQCVKREYEKGGRQVIFTNEILLALLPPLVKDFHFNLNEVILTSYDDGLQCMLNLLVEKGSPLESITKFIQTSSQSNLATTQQVTLTKDDIVLTLKNNGIMEITGDDEDIKHTILQICKQNIK